MHTFLTKKKRKRMIEMCRKNMFSAMRYAAHSHSCTAGNKAKIVTIEY